MVIKKSALYKYLSLIEKRLNSADDAEVSEAIGFLRSRLEDIEEEVDLIEAVRRQTRN